eukprot:10587881-Alexandrium_andersonii.AAC.1
MSIVFLCMLPKKCLGPWLAKAVYSRFGGLLLVVWHRLLTSRPKSHVHQRGAPGREVRKREITFRKGHLPGSHTT